MKKKLILAALALSFGTAANASILLNGDFEAGLDNWEQYGTVGWSNALPYYGGGSTEANGHGIVAFNWGDEQGVSNLWQWFATDSGRTYKVSFDYGTNNTISQTIDVHIYDENLGPDYYAGEFSASGPALSHFSFEFVATGSEAVLLFTDQPENYTYSTDGLLDNIVVEQVPATPNDVPEPASIALLGLGLAGMGALRRRTR